MFWHCYIAFSWIMHFVFMYLITESSPYVWMKTYAMLWNDCKKTSHNFFYSKTYSKIIFVEWGGFRGLTTTNYMAFLAIFATNYQLFCIIFTNYLIWTPHFNNYQLSHYRHDIFFWETIWILKILPFPIQLLRCKHRLHQFTNLSKCI